MKRTLASCFHLLLLLVALGLIAGCATPQNNHDPMEKLNRGTDKFNDGIDRLTLKPISQGYVAVTPSPFRTAISNFYDNITYLNTVLNDFLQGKGKQGFADLGRFLINTTLGVGGLVDVAKSFGLEKHQEDFGQTLAVWGANQGAYIVYPLLGPNSVRNTPDFITATATDGTFWIGLFAAPAVWIPLTAMKFIDKRSRLLDASKMRDELALDPYVFTRAAWRQNREYLIYDGNPPTSAEDDDWDDEFDDAFDDAGDNEKQETDPASQ
jgi:ABC-type transporter lipoprotein component MlaA